MVIGTKASDANAAWTGFFVTTGLRFDLESSRFTSTVGAVNATPAGAVFARRTRQSDGLFDASPLITYTLGADGAGAWSSTSGKLNVASTGAAFSSTGIDVIDSSTYEIHFGARMLTQAGTGVFLNPLGVLNGASFAPPGYPISPGAFINLYGTGLGAQTTTARIPFPVTLGGVQVTINNLPAPIYAVSPSRIDCVVPYAATGSTATIVVTVNGTRSNSIEVPLAASSPGVFSIPQNGLGDGAILRANFSVVTPSNPARPGEVVQLFLSGLGAVNPTVVDGAAAPGREPLARVPAPLRVTVGGIDGTISYQGLAPNFNGLYQVNVQIPPNLGTGTHSVAVQTLEGFTDMVNVRVQQ
jgi:uncharacterized protein (TIGR03437 family)